jgi:hypothetical protein
MARVTLQTAKKRLREGVSGAPISAELVEIRKRRYQSEIKR